LERQQGGGDAAGGDGQGGAGGKGPSGDKLHELVGHNKALTSLSFSTDGRLLVSTSEDGTMRTVRRPGSVRDIH
jgi:WD40 repeat protein